MDPLPPRSRLGTTPPLSADTALEPDDQHTEHRLGLSVCLDRPFLELKQFLVGELERVYVERCLAQSAMNLSRASRLSGLSRKHLRTLIAKHGISREVRDDHEDVAAGADGDS
jgi:DNA-binding NtrC family response regulator